MAEIFDSTGKSTTKSDLLSVTKGFEALLITTDVAFSALTTEEISIEIQRAGKNTQITNGFMKVRDYLLMNAAGTSAICHDVDGNMSVLCDLTDGGDIHLMDKEEVRIYMRGLKTTNSWKLNTVETFATARNIYQYELKIVNADQKRQDVGVDLADLLLIDNADGVTDLKFHYENGEQVEYTLRELRAIGRQIDPIALIDGTGAIKTGFSDKIQVVVAGVTHIEVNKAQGTVFNVIMRSLA